MTEPEVELINDWAELHEAVDVFDKVNKTGALRGSWEDMEALFKAIEVCSDLVPRLLTQYDSLLETSYALTEGWEAYVKANPPSRLYLPGNR